MFFREGISRYNKLAFYARGKYEVIVQIINTCQHVLWSEDRVFTLLLRLCIICDVKESDSAIL